MHPTFRIGTPQPWLSPSYPRRMICGSCSRLSSSTSFSWSKRGFTTGHPIARVKCVDSRRQSSIQSSPTSRHLSSQGLSPRPPSPYLHSRSSTCSQRTSSHPSSFPYSARSIHSSTSYCSSSPLFPSDTPSSSPSPSSSTTSSSSLPPLSPTPTFTTPPSTHPDLLALLYPLLHPGPDGAPSSSFSSPSSSSTPSSSSSSTPSSSSSSTPPYSSSSPPPPHPLGGWTLTGTGLSLTRIYKFRRFKDAMTFSNGVAAIAKTRKHHPTLCIDSASVLVRWSTHRDRHTGRAGLSLLDMKCAAETARVAMDLAPVGVGEENSLAWWYGGGREEFEREVEGLVGLVREGSCGDGKHGGEGDNKKEGGKESGVDRTARGGDAMGGDAMGGDAMHDPAMHDPAMDGLAGKDWMGEAEHYNRVHERRRTKDYLDFVDRAREEEKVRFTKWKAGQGRTT